MASSGFRQVSAAHPRPSPLMRYNHSRPPERSHVPDMDWYQIVHHQPARQRADVRLRLQEPSVQVTPVAPTVPPACQQPGEMLDQRPWVKSRSCARPMVELEAGSGTYYRAQVITMSQDQALMFFAEDHGPGRFEWVFRTSSRIVRKQYKANEWKHRGHGAWALKSDARSRVSKQRGKGPVRRKAAAGTGAFTSCVFL
jgi:hypothetical protein